MIRRLLRRGIRIGAVVGAILFLVQVFLRNPRPKDRDIAPSATPPPPAPAKKAPAKTAPKPAAPAAETMSNGSGDTTATWADPVDGACPPGFPVKVKLASGIFHVPGGLAYDRTAPDRCYRDATGAEADGFRQAKR